MDSAAYTRVVLRYAITNGRAERGTAAALARRCAQIAQAGVDFVLVREKHLAAGELVELCKSVVAAVRESGCATRVLVARRTDVAMAAGMHGVHLSAAKGELTPLQVRSLMPHAYVSISCHTLVEVAQARDAGASAVLFAPIFGKTVNKAKAVAGVGLETLHEACRIARPTPVFALGGVTQDNASTCTACDAAGIAGIRMFFPG